MSLKTAVVILNWNTRHYLENFLPSVIKYNTKEAEIIIADNGSTDDSIEFIKIKYPSVRIISLNKNEGFTGGYNESLKQVDAEYYVLLNSDVEVTENWLTDLVEFMDAHPDAGICQPKILSFHEKEKFEYAGAAGGFIDKFGYPFCRGRIFNTLEKDEHQYDDARRIFWATGACMIVRSALYKQLNGLDPVFFAHMEEIDFCWRAQLRGQHVYINPRSSVYHVGGGSLPKTNPRKTYLNFRNNLLLIYKNSHPKRVNSILRARFFLDYFASFLFLFSGSYADTIAVWKARRDFKKLKSTYNKKTETDPAHTESAESLIYSRSIIWDYYICARKRFTSLKWRS
jgi:GT2 family glycosyltransferase